MKISPRSLKLAGLLSEKIPRLISKFLTPEQIGLITVTAVEVSGDLSVADVFIRSLEGPQNFLALIRKSNKKITHELLKELPLRRPIKLRFKPDKSVQYVEKINHLL